MPCFHGGARRRTRADAGRRELEHIGAPFGFGDHDGFAAVSTLQERLDMNPPSGDHFAMHMQGRCVWSSRPEATARRRQCQPFRNVP